MRLCLILGLRLGEEGAYILLRLPDVLGEDLGAVDHLGLPTIEHLADLARDERLARPWGVGGGSWGGGRLGWGAVGVGGGWGRGRFGWGAVRVMGGGVREGVGVGGVPGGP